MAGAKEVVWVKKHRGARMITQNLTPGYASWSFEQEDKWGDNIYVKLNSASVDRNANSQISAVGGMDSNHDNNRKSTESSAKVGVKKGQVLPESSNTEYPDGIAARADDLPGAGESNRTGVKSTILSSKTLRSSISKLDLSNLQSQRVQFQRGGDVFGNDDKNGAGPYAGRKRRRMLGPTELKSTHTELKRMIEENNITPKYSAAEIKKMRYGMGQKKKKKKRGEQLGSAANSPKRSFKDNKTIKHHDTQNEDAAYSPMSPKSETSPRGMFSPKSMRGSNKSAASFAESRTGRECGNEEGSGIGGDDNAAAFPSSSWEMTPIPEDQEMVKEESPAAASIAKKKGLFGFMSLTKKVTPQAVIDEEQRKADELEENRAAERERREVQAAERRKYGDEDSDDSDGEDQDDDASLPERAKGNHCSSHYPQ
jgi:hypothetical protein